MYHDPFTTIRLPRSVYHDLFNTHAVPRGLALCVKAPRTRAPCTRCEVASHKGATYHERSTTCVLTRSLYGGAGSLWAWGVGGGAAASAPGGAMSSDKCRS